MTERGLSFGGDDDESTPPQYSETVNVSPVEGKLKVLFLAANPDDRTRLKLDEEYREVRAIIQASKFRDQIEVTMLPALRHSDLDQALMEVKPHIVHFSGHGDDRFKLILQDDQGNSHHVNRKAIAELFKTLRDDIRLVVFNVCFSKPQAEGIVENIAFAIGMNQAIGDKAAIEFAKGLYKGIGNGRTVQDAFDLGTHALRGAGNSEELTPKLLNHPKAQPGNAKLINASGEAIGRQNAEAAFRPQQPPRDSKPAWRRLRYLGMAVGLLVIAIFVIPLFVRDSASTPFTTLTDVVRAMSEDIDTVPVSEQQYQRYLTLIHLSNNPNVDPDIINKYEEFITVALPSATEIGASRTLYRVDLRADGWKAETWKRLLREYPYGLTFEYHPDDLVRKSESNLKQACDAGPTHK